MTRQHFKTFAACAALSIAFSFALSMGEAMAQALATPPAAASAPKVMKIGDVLSGQLNAMKVRAPQGKGKRVNSYQLVSEPRRLPAPSGLCNLETGPETFEIVAANPAQATQLQKLVGKEVSLKVAEIACAEQAGQMSEALVTKWSVVAKPN
ncbi:hypothetical protein BH11PSE4_BH11PSE4_40700 [soil metagenome]